MISHGLTKEGEVPSAEIERAVWRMRNSSNRRFSDTEVASKVYDLRTKAGLSQGVLAKKAGTTASVICRLEDADYEGNSLAMLRRIAEAVGKRLQIRLISAAKPKGPKARQVA